MTLKQCQYLVAISKYNSISKAADMLYVTQPSISKAIKDLEEEFEITILDRSNKGVSFTEEGTEFLFYAKMLIEQTETITYHFAKKKAAGLMTFSISSQHYGFVVKSFADLMNCLSEYKYELTLNEGKAIDVIDDVYTGKSIIGVLSISNLNQEYFNRYFVSKSLVFTALFATRVYVFLRKEHPLANEKVITLKQLHDYPYLTYHQDDILLYFAEEVVDINSIEKKVYLEDRGAMNNLLSNTDAYNIGTGSIVVNYMNPNIISIPLDIPNELQIGYIKRYDQLLPREMNTYIEYLTKSLIKSMP